MHWSGGPRRPTPSHPHVDVTWDGPCRPTPSSPHVNVTWADLVCPPPPPQSWLEGVEWTMSAHPLPPPCRSDMGWTPPFTRWAQRGPRTSPPHHGMGRTSLPCPSPHQSPQVDCWPPQVDCWQKMSTPPHVEPIRPII